jgi:hypothetical protein
MKNTKKLIEIANEIAEVTKELMYDSIHWQLSDFEQDGDEYNEIHSYVMRKAINKLYKNNTVSD